MTLDIGDKVCLSRVTLGVYMPDPFIAFIKVKTQRNYCMLH